MEKENRIEEYDSAIIYFQSRTIVLKRDREVSVDRFISLTAKFDPTSEKHEIYYDTYEDQANRIKVIAKEITFND